MLDAATTSEFRLSDGAESVRANALLDRLRGAERINEVVIVQSETVTVDSPEFRAKVEAIHGELLSLGSKTLTGAFHYYQTNEPSLVLSGGLDEIVENADSRDSFRVLMVGEASAAHNYSELAEGDLRWGSASASRCQRNRPVACTGHIPPRLRKPTHSLTSHCPQRRSPIPDESVTCLGRCALRWRRVLDSIRSSYGAPKRGKVQQPYS